jgi:hypothetical protein
VRLCGFGYTRCASLSVGFGLVWFGESASGSAAMVGRELARGVSHSRWMGSAARFVDVSQLMSRCCELSAGQFEVKGQLELDSSGHGVNSIWGMTLEQALGVAAWCQPVGALVASWRGLLTLRRQKGACSHQCNIEKPQGVTDTRKP